MGFTFEAQFLFMVFNTPCPIEVFQDALALMRQARRIVIISHRAPDADSIGANLALREQLEKMGKYVVSACADPVPENCLFMKDVETFVDDFNPEDFDLIISVDCGAHDLLKFHETKPELLDRSKTTLINIDHHATNDHFGNVNIVMDNTPATCFILFLMFTSYGWEISQNCATNLMHGLYYDTGSFMHSNTNSDVLRIAARLKARGADHGQCVRTQFHTTSIPKLRLWGRALGRAQLNGKQAVVTALTSSDFAELNAKFEDLSGVINYLNHVPEARFCLMLCEDKEGQIKGSMRTLRDDVDLSQIASLFGGGGHKKAAGFTIPGRLSQKLSWKINA